jgi:hypothetical protein
MGQHWHQYWYYGVTTGTSTCILTTAAASIDATSVSILAHGLLWTVLTAHRDLLAQSSPTIVLQGDYNYDR